MAEQQYGDEGITLDNETGDAIRALEPTGGLQPVVTAEINQAVATAHMYPRRRDKEIINEITGRATLDEGIASECNYSLSRGGKTITGPSIRFAEIVRASFGNIRVAARFVALDLADRERAAVIVEAVALDLESNSSEIIPVRRSIMTSGKQGQKPQIYSADMINMTMNAGCSVARRNAILAVAPKALWIGPYQRVIKVLQGTADTLGERRVKMIEAFASLDVAPEVLFAALGVKDASDIRVDHMPIMIGMMTAIKDGETVDSVLGRMGTTETPQHARVNNPLKDEPQQTAKPAARGAPAADAQAEKVVNGKGEVTKERAAEPAKDEAPAEKTVKADPPKKDDPISSGPIKVTGQTDVTAQESELTKQASKPAGDVAPDGYGDEDTYLIWMRWHIVHAKSVADLKDKFGKSRADRRELLGADALAAITAEYNAKMVELMGGGED